VGQFDCGRIVNWKTDSPKRILGTCQNPVIDPVSAARFMTAANTLQRRVRSAALNAPCAVQQSRIGTPLGFLDIDSLPVQLGRRVTTSSVDKISEKIDTLRDQALETNGSVKLIQQTQISQGRMLDDHEARLRAAESSARNALRNN
jgi:hypothetical protein